MIFGAPIGLPFPVMGRALLGLGLLSIAGGGAAWAFLRKRPEHEQLPPPGPGTVPFLAGRQLAAAAEPVIAQAVAKANNLMRLRARTGQPVYGAEPGADSAPFWAAPGVDPFWDLAWKAHHGREVRLIFLSAKTGLSPKVLDAVMQVESGGRRWDLVRFEPHRFLRLRPDLQSQIPYHASETDPHFAGRADVGPWSFRRSEVGREALDRAVALDPAAAVESTSFGAFQVMGWALLPEGSTPAAALRAFDGDPEAVSERTLVRWLEANPEAKRAAAAREWVRFAHTYNGGGKAQVYGDKLASAWRGSRLPAGPTGRAA